MSLSVDQWPQTTVDEADFRVGCSNHGAYPAGVCEGSRFSLSFIVSSAVQKRSRVHALTTTRNRS